MPNTREQIMWQGPTGEERIAIIVRPHYCGSCAGNRCLHVALHINGNPIVDGGSSAERRYAHLDWETAAAIMAEIADELDTKAQSHAAHHPNQDALF